MKPNERTTTKDNKQTNKQTNKRLIAYYRFWLSIFNFHEIFENEDFL